MEKRKKKIILFSLVFVFFWGAWASISLRKLKDRSVNYELTSDLKNDIQKETKGFTCHEIYKYSLTKTSEILSFSSTNNLRNGKANCVGYAQMCASVANYSFAVNQHKCKAKPVVGYVMLWGVNLCNVLICFMPSEKWKNFVKDHDFVEFSGDGDSFYADASFYDLFFNDCKTCVNK